MATVYTTRTETGAQSVTHATGATTVAYEFVSSGATADTIHFAKIPAGATVTDIKVSGVDALGGGNVTLGWTADPNGFLEAENFDATPYMTHSAKLRVPNTFATATDAVVGFSAPLTDGAGTTKTIGLSLTYTTEFVER